MSNTRIPTAPFLLGLSGLLPFLWGALSVIFPSLLPALQDAVPMFFGQTILALYGLTILAFMSGTLWGFATLSAQPVAAWGYAFSVVPALWGVASFAFPDDTTCALLALGLVVLLPLDIRAITLGEAPKWWLKLRLILTAVAVVCLMVGAYA